MIKKNIVGLIAIVAIVVVATFAGCIEEGEAPVSTPTPTATQTPEITESPTPTPTPTSTPLPEPKYVPGDIIAKEPTNKDCLWTVISYDEATDEYETNYIFHNRDGTWGHFANEDTSWWERDYVEESHPTLIDHVDLSTVTIGEPTWHRVASFSASRGGETDSFYIKGDEWRVKYSAKTTCDTVFWGVIIWPRDDAPFQTRGFECEEFPCSGTEYINEGSREFYFVVVDSSLWCDTSWKLEVEEYY